MDLITGAPGVKFSKHNPFSKFYHFKMLPLKPTLFYILIGGIVTLALFYDQEVCE